MMMNKSAQAERNVARTHQPVYVIFLGPPGSGKGTQADKLQDRYGLVHLSTGDLFRENISKGTELGLKVKDILAKGELVPDDVTLAMVMQRLARPDTEQGVIFDGFPRTIEQAEGLDRAFTGQNKQIAQAIYFYLDDEVIIERLGARRVCPKCGTVYNMISKPPREDELCDLDQTPLTQRNDDRPEVVRNRLNIYRELTQPLIGYYRQRNLLSELNADQSIDIIEQELDRLTESLLANAS